MNKSYVLFTSLLVVTSNYVNADDYFDPALLATTVGKQNDIDLSIFSNPGGGIEGEREVKIYLNDIFYKQTTLDFKNNSSGVLEPVFPDYFFDNQLQKEIKVSNGNITVSDIYESIPYSKVSYDQSTSRIDISIPQAYTISSTPGVSEYITLTVRRIDDGVGSQWLTRDVKRGDYLWLNDTVMPVSSRVTRQETTINTRPATNRRGPPAPIKFRHIIINIAVEGSTFTPITPTHIPANTASVFKL